MSGVFGMANSNQVQPSNQPCLMTNLELTNDMAAAIEGPPQNDPKEITPANYGSPPKKPEAITPVSDGCPQKEPKEITNDGSPLRGHSR